jgi:hypothetical protein
MKIKGGHTLSQPFEYSQIFYNDVIYYLEQKWERRLTDHEKSVLIEGYRFGRLVESENEIKILGAN